MTDRWRCLIWVQSLLGSGHLRRALILAEAIAGRGAEVTLVNGGSPGPWPVPAGVQLIQLPPVTARNGDFGDLVDADDRPFDEKLRTERQRTLLGLLRIQPHVILTELFPFGRRTFRSELLPLLETAARSQHQPIVAATVRDILVTKPDLAHYRWMVETCLAHYDRVLVHGDERLMPFAASFPPAAELGGRVTHTGFVHVGAAEAPADETPAVLISAGGGAVGERLLRAALESRPATRYGALPWLLVGGQNLPSVVFADLQARLPAGCTLERYRADLAALMGRAEVSVSQAGYNTVVEGLEAAARMVLVPFAAGGEDEQTQRAERLSALEVAEQVSEATVDGSSLAAAIDRIGARPRPDPGRWSFDGAEHAATLLAEMVRERFSVA